MGSGSQPVFGSDDRVVNTPGDDLEASLVGKSPKEIAQIIRDREAAVRPVTPQVTINQPPTPSTAEFWNEPGKSVDRQIQAKALSREEYNQVAAQIRPTLRWAAKNIVKEQHADFFRVEKDIDAIMAKVPEHLHTDPTMWETCYIQAKGIAHDRLSEEDRKAPVATGERVQVPGFAPTPEEDLTKVTSPGAGNKTAATVCDRLGVTHDGYRKSRTILEGDGKLPLTVDNRGRR